MQTLVARTSHQSGGFVFVEHGGRLTDQCVSIDGGRVFLAAPQPLDLVVDAHGFRRLRLPGVFENREVRLEPGLAVELQLEVEDLPADCAVRLGLRPAAAAALAARPWIYSPAAGGSLPGRYAPQALPCAREDGAHRARVSAPGEYAVEAVLARRGDERLHPLAVRPATVVVREDQDPARAAVRVDPDSLRAALAGSAR